MGWCHTTFCSCFPGGCSPLMGVSCSPSTQLDGSPAVCGARVMLCTTVTHSICGLESRLHTLPSALLAAPGSWGGMPASPWDHQALGDPARPRATLPQPGTHLILLYSTMAAGTDPSQDGDDTMSRKNCSRTNLGDRDVPLEDSDPLVMCIGQLGQVGGPGQ